MQHQKVEIILFEWELSRLLVHFICLFVYNKFYAVCRQMLFDEKCISEICEV